MITRFAVSFKMIATFIKEYLMFFAISLIKNENAIISELHALKFVDVNILDLNGLVWCTLFNNVAHTSKLLFQTMKVVNRFFGHLNLFLMRGFY